MRLKVWTKKQIKRLWPKNNACNMKLTCLIHDVMIFKIKSTIKINKEKTWSISNGVWVKRRFLGSMTSIIQLTTQRQMQKKQEAKMCQGDLNRRASSTWIIWNQTGFKSHECSPCNKFGTCSLLLSINRCIANAHLLLRRDSTTLMQSVGALMKRTNKCKATLMRKIRRYQIG